MRFIEVTQETAIWHDLSVEIKSENHLINVDAITEIYPIEDRLKGINICRIILGDKNHFVNANEPYEDIKRKIYAAKKVM